MSLERKEIITCPQCKTQSEFVVWDSINVDLDPEMRDKVLNNEAFQWHCPHCGAKAYIPFGTLYHDMRHKFMLMFTPDEPTDHDKYETTDIPEPLGGTTDQYTFRCVYGINNLKEKIHIFEHELNDVAIEKLKYILTHYVDDFAYDDEEIFFAGVTNADERNKYGRMIFQRLSPEVERFCMITTPMEKYYEQCLSLELDHRFDAKGWMCVDQGWIAQQIKRL